MDGCRLHGVRRCRGGRVGIWCSDGAGGGPTALLSAGARRWLCGRGGRWGRGGGRSSVDALVGTGGSRRHSRLEGLLGAACGRFFCFVCRCKCFFILGGVGEIDRRAVGGLFVDGWRAWCSLDGLGGERLLGCGTLLASRPCGGVPEWTQSCGKFFGCRGIGRSCPFPTRVVPTIRPSFVRVGHGRCGVDAQVQHS